MELCESSRYGLLERIPDLLAIVSVDVAYAVSRPIVGFLIMMKHEMISQLIFLQQYFPIPVLCNITAQPIFGSSFYLSTGTHSL